MKHSLLVLSLISISTFCFADNLRSSFETSSPLINSEVGFEPCLPLLDYFTQVAIYSELSNNGRTSLNFTPNGNPVTQETRTNYCTSPTLTVSSTILSQDINVRRARNLEISFFYYSTSNPQLKETHNCDSSLNIYLQKDGVWEPLTAVCGEHKTENTGWKEVRLSVPLRRNKTVNLGFSYQLQSSHIADPSTVFLIDDLLINPTR